VTEDEACLIQGHTIPQHLRGRCVTEQVRTLGGSIDVGAFESVFHHRRDTIPGGKWPAWSIASNKHVIGVDVRGAAFQVAEQRVADVLWEGQSHLISSLPYHLQRAAVPVDVGETQTRYISGTQP
jgi:hypothetical protein